MAENQEADVDSIIERLLEGIKRTKLTATPQKREKHLKSNLFL